MITEPLTAARNPAAEAWLAEVVTHAAREAAELPDVQAVLLGGSLARGEAVVSAENGRHHLRGDIELYLVGRRPALRRRAADLSDRLSREHDLEISVAWLSPARLAQGRAKNLSYRPSRTLLGFDLAVGARTLAGARPVIARSEASELPLAEGVRQLLNRAAEGAGRVSSPDVEGRRWRDKLLAACGDTVLLAAHAYSLGLRDRFERLHADEVLLTGWVPGAEGRAAILGSYLRRLGEAADEAGLEVISSTFEGVLLEAVARDLGIRRGPGLLDRFPIVFAEAAARRPEYLRYLPPFGPASTYEALMTALRIRRAGLALTHRWGANVLCGLPASLLLQGTGGVLCLAQLAIATGAPQTDVDPLLQAARDGLRRAAIPEASFSGRSPDELSGVLRQYLAASA
jgi:hypothetical protein